MALVMTACATAMILILLYIFTPLNRRIEVFFAYPRYTFFLISLLSAFVLIYFANYLLIERPHDWDVDSYIYLGSRLDAGELIFIHDFETKLPIVQYIFWLPYKLGGLGSWRIITFAVSALSSYFAAESLTAMLTGCDPHLGTQTKKIAALTACFYMLLMYMSPGADVGHISIVASDFIFLGIAFYLDAVFYRTRSVWLPVASGILVALAVSIRPHFLFTLPVFLLPSFATDIDKPLLARMAGAARTFIAFAAAFAFVSAAQFAPYAIGSAGLRVLADVPRVFSQFSTGTSLAEIVSRQISYAESLPVFLVLVFAIPIVFWFAISAYGRHKHDRIYRKLLVLSSFSFISIFLLYASFVRTHFYAHYNQMLIPYITLLVVCLVTIGAFRRQDKNESGTSAFLNRFHSIFAAAGLCAAIVFSSFAWYGVEGFWLQSSAVTFAINNHAFDPTLTSLLRAMSARNLKYYLPDDINYHWLLHEPRIGDGHPAMLHAVLSGTRVGPMSDLYLYSDAAFESPCSVFATSDKDIIIVQGDRTDILNCFTDANSVYAPAPAETISNEFSTPLSPLASNTYLYLVRRR